MGASTHPLWSSSDPDNSAHELDSLVAAGANTVRVDVDWSSLETSGPGQRSRWYVDKADAFFAAARARGLRVAVTFWGTPCWASTAPSDVKQDCEGSWWDRGVTRYPPSDPSDFAAAAAWTINRWGSDMAAFEVWNEPNLRLFFQTDDPVNAYMALLRPTYDAVKAANPAVPVLAPGMLYSDGRFLNNLYLAGLKDYSDAISSHPFNQWRAPDAEDPTLDRKYLYAAGVPWVHDVMAAHGDGDKHVWFTELGWSSCAPSGTSSWCITQDQQAQYIGDALRMIRDRWDFVDAALVYTLRNTGSSLSDRESQMGMLFRDFGPKPAYGSFTSALTDLAANPEPPPPAAPPPPPPTAEPAVPPPPVAAPREPAVEAVAPRDTRRPRLTGLASLRIERGRAGRLRFRLSEPARVRFTVLEPRRGRRPAPRGSFTREGAAGWNRPRFGGRAGGRVLGPGAYVLSAVATDAAGNRSSRVRARLRVVR